MLSKLDCLFVPSSLVSSPLLVGPLTEASPPPPCSHGGMFTLATGISTFANLESGSKLSTGEEVSSSLLGFLFLSPNITILGSLVCTSSISNVDVPPATVHSGCSCEATSSAVIPPSSEDTLLLPLPIFTVRRMDCSTSVSNPGTKELAKARALSELVEWLGVAVVVVAVVAVAVDGTAVPIATTVVDNGASIVVAAVVTGFACVGCVVMETGTKE